MESLGSGVSGDLTRRIPGTPVPPPCSTGGVPIKRSTTLMLTLPWLRSKRLRGPDPSVRPAVDRTARWAGEQSSTSNAEMLGSAIV